MSFKSKVVLITGAASGIGAATARHFARLNASLVLVDINDLRETSKDCGDKVLTIVADVSNDADVTRMVKEAVDHYGRLDVLCNVAGVFESANIEGASMEHFDRIFSVKIRGVFNLTVRCVPYLIETRGSVVNVSSAATHRQLPMTHVYGMSKAAVNFLTKSVSLELAASVVRVNAVQPTAIDTNIMNLDRLPELKEMMSAPFTRPAE